MDSSGEKKTVTLQRNPFLISAVIHCIFEYLPLDDIKQCRTLCHEWNSVSIQIMNKKSKINLDSNERRTNFLELYKAYDPPTFLLTTFHLEFSHTKWNTEECDKLVELFHTLREQMKTLIFEDGRAKGITVSITPFIEIANNLVSLTLSSQNFDVQLDKLANIKYLSLIGCCVSLDSFGKRIAPLRIRLMNLTFEQNEKELQEILINDYLDFGRSSEIVISSSRDSVITFDMSRDIVSARKVHFNRIRVINSKQTPAKVDKKMLPFEKLTGMGIKELDCRSSLLSLSLLPKSLEKLSLNRNIYVSSNCVPVDLPNLKCLFLGPIKASGTVNMSATSYDMGIITSMLRLCPKLVDVEFSVRYTSDRRYDINVDLLPVNLKRIQFLGKENINLVGDTVIHVDSLILDNCAFADTQNFMLKIKPKIVVVQLQPFGVEDPAHEIVSFVEESRNFEKIVIKLPVVNDAITLTSCEMALSTYVDDGGKSKCYEFTNRVGKRLTEEEFKMYWLQF